MDDNKIITPKSKVLQVIEQYPQLEEVLIDYVPAFKKLKNPFLRKTVGKITTLQQAASIGGVKVEDLVNRLRKEAGQDLYKGDATTSYQTSQPGWFDPARIHDTVDAEAMLAEGNHPVNQVMADLKNMPEGSIIQLSAGFLPAPLIDKASSVGIAHWVYKKGESSYLVYFHKPAK